MIELIFASQNKGKIREVKNILTPPDFEIIGLPELKDIPEIEETGSTFEENALIKAQTVFRIFGKPVIADDSGLSVEQLNGAPGVHSARYAGESANSSDNNEKLLRELKRFPQPHKAKYVCCALYYDGTEYLASFGEVKGRIVYEARGTGGFGYDPYFIPDGYDLTMSELPGDEKNRISHRGKAFLELRRLLAMGRKMT